MSDLMIPCPGCGKRAVAGTCQVCGAHLCSECMKRHMREHMGGSGVGKKV